MSTIQKKIAVGLAVVCTAGANLFSLAKVSTLSHRAFKPKDMSNVEAVTALAIQSTGACVLALIAAYLVVKSKVLVKTPAIAAT